MRSLGSDQTLATPARLQPKSRRGPLVRIYRPCRSAMQSGKANSKRWVLEFEPQSPAFVEPLMGWIGCADTRQQVRINFPTREAAVRFAERQGWLLE